MIIDSNFFNTFLVASKSLNFTDTARRLAMTQSGVSQHISKLEEQVGAPLFLRVGKKVLLTPIGHDLQKFIEQYQDSLLRFNENVQNATVSVQGKVRYAMPESCLLSPHFSILLKEKGKHYPDIELEVDLCSSDMVIEKVINNEIDFGFVTHKIENDDLCFEPFCEEEYVVVSSHEAKIEKETNFVSYPGSSKIYEAWLGSQSKKQGRIAIKFKSRSNSLNAALVMVSHGLGCAILPRHCVETSLFKNKMKIHDEIFSGCRNQIYIVYLKTEFNPKRVQVIQNIFRKMVAKK